MNVTKTIFGEIDNRRVESYTITNNHGMTVKFINYGCIITDIMVPDREGKLENVVLGYDTIEEYLNERAYFGAIIGRVAGRITGAQFELDGETYTLEQNENSNHLHGGFHGFNRVIWDAAIIEEQDTKGVEFTYVSQDGEGGYPGTLKMSVKYLLNNENEFTIHITGLSDKKTILNCTNHSYFNLSGDIKRDILDHTLTLKCEKFLPINEQLLPTGDLADVAGTPFDFQNGQKIREGTRTEYPQNLLAGKGYDHPFVLDANQDQEILLEDQESGRMLIVETNQPGVVIYTSNQLQGDFKIRGVQAQPYLGICLETQGLPDAIHHPHFPTIVLEKEKQYNAITKYRFGVI
ncbi:galactose mutarotase [Robertmurraya yapensis]|uniref:Aldose 1-epimerase n=2 Tax=Bacillaceae TaxID=186817 RepID=A0A3S0IJM5_9BACI|nr:aldose epimerase family protein [Bacillus yapensis]RTR33977.1 galactose mutarotase [Bacillus yapensis]TKS97295.1 galactose-1-epimerase [Bacillus yapensis]